MPELDAVDVLVMAGGINRIALYEGYTPGYKALLPIDGRPAIQYTLEALWGSPAVRSVAVVGDQKALESSVSQAPAIGRVEFIPSGETIIDSVMHGLRHCTRSEMVLVTTADLPLLTSAAIRDFLAACKGALTRWERNAFLAVVPKQCYRGDYARFTKPFNRFRDVSICHGNVALVDPRVAEDKEAMLRFQKMYAGRKNPISSALAVGMEVGLAYGLGVHLLHWLTLPQMAAIASRRFRTGLVPVLLEHPEVSIDIDEAADYQFVVDHIRGQRPTATPAGHSGDQSAPATP